MGFFDKLADRKKEEICAPVTGRIIDITEVSDPTFSEKILGDGMAVIPADGKFYAPCDGTLESLYPTGHAYSIKAETGAELLVHIGIDTVKLKGQFFTIHAVQGQKVKKGDLLIEADIDKIVEAGYDVTTPVIIMNTSDYKKIQKMNGDVTESQTLMILDKK